MRAMDKQFQKNKVNRNLDGNKKTTEGKNLLFSYLHNKLKLYS